MIAGPRWHADCCGEVGIEGRFAVRSGSPVDGKRLSLVLDEHAGIANVHLDAVEHGEGIVFLHALQDGPASRSYGLAVAALAGMPKPVVTAARRKLKELERVPARRAQLPAEPDPQLPLFAPEPNAVVEALSGIDPDSLSPREALAALYHLKSLLP